MVNPRIEKEISAEESRILGEMRLMDPSTDEYLNAAKSLKTISESKTEEKKGKIDLKVVVENGLKILAGIGLIALSTTHILDDRIERTADRIIPKNR